MRIGAKSVVIMLLVLLFAVSCENPTGPDSDDNGNDETTEENEDDENGDDDNNNDDNDSDESDPRLVSRQIYVDVEMQEQTEETITFTLESDRLSWFIEEFDYQVSLNPSSYLTGLEHVDIAYENGKVNVEYERALFDEIDENQSVQNISDGKDSAEIRSFGSLRSSYFHSLQLQNADGEKQSLTRNPDGDQSGVNVYYPVYLEEANAADLRNHEAGWIWPAEWSSEDLEYKVVDDEGPFQMSYTLGSMIVDER